MLLMLDTSHSPICPRGPLGQSPSGDNLRHALTALLSLGLDCGENAEVGWGAVGPRRNVEITTIKVRKVYIISDKVRIRVILGFTFAHTPPLQEFGDMLTRIIRNRPQSRDGKRICACWCIASLVVCCLCLYAYLCA